MDRLNSKKELLNKEIIYYLNSNKLIQPLQNINKKRK
jgi:hypothetical protein